MYYKLYLSVLLTPICDKFATLLIGNSDNGQLTLSSEGYTIVNSFKLIVAINLYYYSACNRGFREDNGNFQDAKGLSDMLDGMMAKLKWFKYLAY